MGLHYAVNLDDRNCTRGIYRCKCCASHLFTSHEIVSRDFYGKFGKAYLVKKVVNLRYGEELKKQMQTGKYDVRDAMCRQCGFYVGWRYSKADNPQMKFKEGMFVVEIPRLTVPDEYKL